MGVETKMTEGIELELDTLSITGDPTKLYEELAKAQSEFIPVPKKNRGQMGKREFDYAGYATIMRCVRPALAKYGISIAQPLHSRGNVAVTTTILAGHGAAIKSSFYFSPHQDPQEFGRHHTYYRRYQLQAILAIEGDKDADDLPDVNEDRAQFSEPAKELKESKPSAAPKASASAEPKPAPAEVKINGFAQPSESTTKSGNGKGKKEPGPPAQMVKTLNILLAEGIKSLGWTMDQAKAFYVEHVDPAGYEKAANLTVEQKQKLHAKLVEVHNVAPF